MSSSYTFQSSGTVAGNAQNSVVMAPTSNGSILLQYKQNNTTVYTRFLKVTALVLQLNAQTRTLSWTDVGAASYDLNVYQGGQLIDTLTVDDIAQTIPSSPFVTRSYTVSCTVNGETLPASNEISVQPLVPELVFQTTQTFEILTGNATIAAGTYPVETVLTQLNEGLQVPDLFTFDGTRVSLSGLNVVIPTGQYTTETILILQRLGFTMTGNTPQIPLNEPITKTEKGSAIQLTQGGSPTAPTQPTLAASDITTTTATLTVDITDYASVQFVGVVSWNGSQWEGTGAGVLQPDSNTVTISLTGLSQNTEQTYAIQTTTSQDLSPVSDSVTFTTLIDAPPPIVATDLVFTSTPIRTPKLEWAWAGEQQASFTVNVQDPFGALLHSLNTNQGFPFFDFPADLLQVGTSYLLSVGDSTQLPVTIPNYLGFTLPTVAVDSVSTNSMVVICTDTNDGSGIGITAFDLTISPANQNGDMVFPDITSPYTITNLASGTTYTISVAAKFTSGDLQVTNPSEPITQTTDIENIILFSSWLFMNSTAPTYLSAVLMPDGVSMQSIASITANLTSLLQTYPNTLFPDNVLQNKYATLTINGVGTLKQLITGSSATPEIFTLQLQFDSGDNLTFNDQYGSSSILLTISHT